MAKKKMKIISLDAETNGLWGEAFAIAAVVRCDGEERARFSARCPISGETEKWVSENVLPEMADIPVTHRSYESMLQDFITFYMNEKENATILVHMGLPVEARLFLDAHRLGFMGDWDAPYPLTDISAIPEIGVSVDSYNKNHGIEVPPMVGGTHNPLYDSVAAALSYEHLMSHR